MKQIHYVFMLFVAALVGAYLGRDVSAYLAAIITITALSGRT